MPDRVPLDVSFAIAAGRLSVLPVPPDVANLSIDIPLGVLTATIRDGLSWDEAFIGYWCCFDRHPNVYHAGFWRLFQAPYFKRRVGAMSAQSFINGAGPLPRDGAPPDAARSSDIGRDSTVAEVLETHGAEADRILRRYGLYCSGCHHSTAESIELAGRQHGVDSRRIDLLIRELNSAFGTSSRRLLVP